MHSGSTTHPHTVTTLSSRVAAIASIAFRGSFRVRLTILGGGSAMSGDVTGDCGFRVVVGVL
jgi:hypothetical protein